MKNKTIEMIKTTHNTYHFNVPEGVTPSDHDIQYDYKTVSDADLGDYYMAEARLEVTNPKSLDEYLEDITGHYVEGVNDWNSAHEYLVDLVQAMLVELVRNTPSFHDVKEYDAVINESYSDGSFIDYSVSYWPENRTVNIDLTASNNLEGKALSSAALDQLLSISVDDLEG